MSGDGEIPLGPASFTDAMTSTNNGAITPRTAVQAGLLSAGTVLLLAVALGVLAGFGEVAFLQLNRLVSGRIVFLGRHAIWMAPVAAALLFSLVGAALLAASRRWPRLRSVRATTAVFVALGALSMLLLVPGVHPLASMVLAAGIGALGGRWADRRPDLVKALSVRAGTALILLVGVIGIVQQARSTYGERSAVSDLPAAPEGAPNVLLLILDTVRARSVSVHGYERPTTPALERLATKGVAFARAFTPAPWTLPAHASMFTGRQPHELSTGWRAPLDREFPTLAEFLRSQGYRTAGFVANMGYVSWETGLDRGFLHYEDHPIALRQLLISSPLVRPLVGNPRVRKLVGSDENFVRKSAADVNRSLLDWLAGQDEAPFFAFLNYYDAHGPYMPPEPFRTRFATTEPRGGVSPLHRWLESPGGPPLTANEVTAERDAYEAAIAYADHHIGLLLDQLRERGLLANTLVLVSSDHGEEFGEHGVYDHGNSLYLAGLHVPLVLYFPDRLPGGTVSTRPVSLRDLPATIVDLLDLEGSPFPGTSLASIVTDPDSLQTDDAEPVLSEVQYAPRLPSWYPVSKGDMLSLVSGRWHYIRSGDGTEELYDVEADPWEANDLAASPRGAEVMKRLRSQAAAAGGVGG